MRLSGFLTQEADSGFLFFFVFLTLVDSRSVSEHDGYPDPGIKMAIIVVCYSKKITELT